MYSKTDIAVIGIGCQFPGAKEYTQYWNNLVAGVNSIKEITADRWDISSYYSLDGSRPNTSSSKWCGMLENADLFDNRFFNISPKEANVMDPQQRLLLEEAYHCIEDSGVSIKQLQQKITSVHVGISAADYGHYTLTDTETDPYAGLGIYKSIAANRLSHAFGLKGISTAVDAACASGLVAISEAYRLLANGESDFALAGAVSLSLHPGRYIAFSRSRMLSPDGQCKTFDKDANGFVPGEGVGVVLLQRAEDAIKEGKHIYAILKGIAVNHGGKTVTITAPRIEAQREVYLDAYMKANITPDTIGYIEAHGTGTSLGDPIEVESLTQAFRRFTDKRQYCKIGSVKTNIGHLEPTAGMAGFIKLVLMLKHKQIPKTLNIRSLNPIIHFEQTPFIPAFETSTWERLDQSLPLRAGVSAFGFGGVNAHALLEEFPESLTIVNGSKLSNQIFTISAKTPAALDKLKEKWKEFAASGSFDQHNVQDVCQTLLNGRVPMEYRFGALVKTKEELISALNKADTFVNRESPVCLKIGNLSFPNYSQIESLLETVDVFRMQYAHVERSVHKYLAGESLEIYLQERNDQRINDFIGVYILTAGLMGLGLSPELVTGEGAGIWVSLVISGMLSLEEAFMHISGKGSDSIQFSRPKISFYDPVFKHVIKPFYFDSEYIDQLISNCSFRDEQAFFPSPDLSDSSQPLAHYVHKARLLSDSQFTFKKFLDEWDAILNKAGFSLNYLLYDDELLTNKENDRASERLLLAFVIISSLEKLNKKWELPEQNSLEDYRFNELLDLVEDEVLSKEDLVQLLTGYHRNDAHIAEKLNSRQQNINVSKPYTLLRKVHQFLKEFGNEAEWLKKAMTCTADSDLKGIAVLTLGEVTGPSDVATSLLPGITADIDYCIKNVLLKLWLKGITIHWDKIFPEGSYFKMALPCYPFEGKSFWKQNKYHIGENNVAERDFPASKTTQIDEEKTLDHSKESTSQKDLLITPGENWNGIFYYKPMWKEVPIGPINESQNTQVLIFADKIGIGKALAGNFKKHTLVFSSDQYRHINNSTFEIDIDQPQHYHEILQKAGTFSKLYFLWGIEKDEKIVSVGAFQSFENRVVKSFFRLCKALASLNSDKPYELIVVTDSLQKVNSYNIPLFPYAAPLLGIAKVMAKENPNICVCCVDMNSPSLHDISVLARENSAGALLEIAYREERRYAKALVPQPDYRNRSDRRFIFRKGGVYIILGGMGGVGFELSLFLASRYQANLILVGRKPLGENQRLDSIRKLGGEVIYVRGDITIDEDMRNVVQQAKERFGAVHGVINSTLVLADMTIKNMSEELFARVLDVKSKGSFILHQVTQDENLDFLVFFSSMLTLQGNPGQCHYIAGCCFQDAYADFLRQAKNQNTVAINWGYWGETGIVANEHFRKKLKKLGVESFLTSEGMEGFKQIMESGEPRVVFTKISSDHFRSLTLDTLSPTPVKLCQTQTRLQAIASDLENEIQQKQWNLDLYDGFCEVEEYSHLLLLRSFQQMGIFVCPGENYTLPALKRDLHIQPKYHRLFDAIVNILERGNIILKKQDSITVSSHVEIASKRILLLADEKNILLRRFPQTKAHLALLDNSVPYIKQILSGELKATEVLFPNSSIELVEAFYHGHRFADYYNLLNAKFIKGFIESIIREKQGGKIRILEIGAGTGATSSLVLQNIAAYGNQLEYCYTDISHAFVKYGKNRFGKVYPFTTFAVLNIEEVTPQKQAELGTFDIIFATNVIHATKNLSITFKGIRALIAPEGCLLLNEFSHVYDFITLTFGLLDGWWLFEDTELRLPFAPLVNPLQWKTFFKENGFNDVRIIGDPAYEDQLQRQCLIVGQYSGVAVKESVNSEDALPDWSDLHLTTSKGNYSDSFVSSLTTESTLHSIDSVKNVLTQVISEALQIDPKDISPDDRFTDLGIDSIVGVETVTRINTALHLDLRTTIVFDYSSINALAVHIVQNHPTFFIAHQEANSIAQLPTHVPVKETTESKNESGFAREVNSEVTGTLRRILARMLDINEQEIGINDRFSELGIDSIVGVDTVNEINKALGLDLSTTIIFDYSSINELAAHISDQYTNVLTRQSDKENTTQTEITSFRPEETKAATFFHPASITQDPRIASDEIPSSRKLVAAQDQDIAIIGVSAKYPGADGINELWKNIESGKDSVTEIPRERWNIDEYYDPAPSKQNKVYSRHGGFLTDIDKFDPLFFKISHKEAELMDPQQRLFLEYCWKAIEDAGYASEDLANKKVGIYVGVRQSDYYSRLLNQNQELDSYVFKGNDCSILTARLAYHLDLKGPSIPIDTACSSSLVAIHLACDQLRTGQLEMAIAGGIFVMTTPQLHIMMCKTNMLSPDGKCKTYDNDANGFVPGEGVGIVILKSLTKALQDGDHIYGVIKGSGMNQDGKTNGITAPSTLSQTDLELEVFKQANITPDSITYVEGHGTGTKLGDPIEIEALTAAFRKYTNRKQYCAIGSIKTNIGHTLTAAGVAGVLKVLLAMKHRKIPPSLNFKKGNEFINFKDSPFYVNTTLNDWIVQGECPRRATVSSFGFSGTNAHLILQEAPVDLTSTKESLQAPYYLIPLSAKTEKALYQKIEDLATWLIEKENSADISDIAFTLSAGRDHFSVRTSLVVKDVHQLTEKLYSLRKQIKKEDAWHEKREAFVGSDSERLEYGNLLIAQLCSNDLSPDQYQAKIVTLAQLYTEGYTPDWKALFAGKSGKRISLPAYPFARESYWGIAAAQTDKAPLGSEQQLNQLHPLVHRNTSTLNEYNFTSLLTGSEFFLTDHVVFGQKVLPGVGYVEMARAAGELLSGKKVKAIKDIVWLRPIVVSKAEEVSISFVPHSSSLQYQVFTNGQHNEKIIHGHGKVVLDTGEKNEGENLFLDIAGIKRKSDSNRGKTECYSRLEALGLKYGPQFQVIQQSFYNGTVALAWLELPNANLNSMSEFGLHPGLMDGVLQTVVGIIKETGSRYLPFALEEVKIISALPNQCYAYAKRRHGSDFQNYTFDIQVADENGRVILLIKGLSLRTVDLSAQTLANTRFQNPAFQQIASKSPSDQPILSMLQKLQNGEIEIIEAEQITDNIL